MKKTLDLQRMLSVGLSGAALMASTALGLAQNTNPTNTFDATGSTASFATWWGPTTPTMTWDGALDSANDANSGSARYSAAFTGAAGEQFMTFFTIANRWGWDGGYKIDATTYTNYSFDIKVDPSSFPIVSGGNYGSLEIGLVTDGWGTVGLPTFTIPLTATNWTHVSRPLNPTMAGLEKVVGFYFKMWSNGAQTNTLTFNIDNVSITKPTVPVVIPPPTLELKKAGPTGAVITMDDNGSQWQRNAISTPSGGGPYTWASQGSYPVSYSLTIADFPAIKSHLGFEAHIYLANGDTSSANDQTGGAPDWTVPDIFIFRVENHRSELHVTNQDLTITTNVTYDAMAQIQWKTNYPAANSTNIPVIAFAPSPVGTWTVTFTDATHGNLTGPGLSATNFTMPEDAVLSNFSPVTSFLQFGMFKNVGANDGHNNQSAGTLSRVAFTGGAAPFDDQFSGATLTNNNAWRKTSASAVQYVPPGTAWVLDWTLPARGFIAQSAPAVTGVWGNAAISSSYTIGSKVRNLIPGAGLGNQNYYRLTKRPFTKLQILLPGETAAPDTATGKTGTPTPQQATVPFNIVVNAVDETWHVITDVSDTVKITSTDAFAFLPADAALSSGTATFSLTLGDAGNSHTITATDVTDATKAAATSAPVQVNF